MAEKKYVALGDKNLQKVWDWTEANRKNPLAVAYWDACSCCGFDWDVARVVLLGDGPVPTNRWMRAYREWDEARVFAFRHRDALGRMILKIIAAS